jgi:hypothetical protein
MFRPAARKNLGRLLSFVLILSGWVSQGHADPARLDIRVQLTGFGKVSREDITAVLESAAGQLWQHCGSKRLPGIDVYHRTDRPETNFSRAANGRIAVGLTTRDTHWAQASGLPTSSVAPGKNDDPKRNDGSSQHANFWLEESL